MRVAIFADGGLEKADDATISIDALLTHAPSDIQLCLYTASSPAASNAEDSPRAAAPISQRFFKPITVCVPRWRDCLRRVIADQVDLLHLTTSGPMGLTAVWISSKTGLPIVGSVHAEPLTSRTGAFGSTYLRWIYGRCVRILVPSLAMRESMITAGSRAAALDLWRRGVDTDLFTPTRRSERLRQQWAVSDRQPALLFAGDLRRGNDLEPLPNLLYRLRTLGVRHRLIVVGRGANRSLRDRLPDAIFADCASRTDVAEAFASADVLVCPGTTAASTVVLEAQASGVPVVVTAAGGAKEQIRPDITGRLCDDDDDRAWAAVLSELLANSDRRRQMGSAARAYALGRTWDVALPQVYDTYRACSRTSGSTSLSWWMQSV